MAQDTENAVAEFERLFRRRNRDENVEAWLHLFRLVRSNDSEMSPTVFHDLIVDRREEFEKASSQALKRIIKHGRFRARSALYFNGYRPMKIRAIDALEIHLWLGLTHFLVSKSAASFGRTRRDPKLVRELKRVEAPQFRSFESWVSWTADADRHGDDWALKSVKAVFTNNFLVLRPHKQGSSKPSGVVDDAFTRLISDISNEILGIIDQNSARETIEAEDDATQRLLSIISTVERGGGDDDDETDDAGPHIG